MRAAMLGAASFLLLAGAVAAAPLPDQQQLVRGGGVSVGGTSEAKVAQTFRPAVAGLLTEVRIGVDCFDAQPLHVEVQPVAYDFAPPGVVYPGLADAVAAVDLQAPPGEETAPRSVALASTPFLPADAPVALVLSSSGRCRAALAPAGTDLYTRGHVFWDARPNPPRWYLLSAASGFGDDLVFQTVVEPACQVPPLATLPPANAVAAIVRYGCAAGTTAAVFSSKVARGRVVSSVPAAGTRLAPGAAVRLLVSKGAKPKPKRR